MPDKIVAEKTCTKCGKSKSLDLFCKVTGTDCQRSICKKCNHTRSPSGLPYVLVSIIVAYAAVSPES